MLLIPSYDLGAVQPYDARYLAAWPAELYDVSMAQASLEARAQAYARMQRRLSSLVAPLEINWSSSAHLRRA